MPRRLIAVLVLTVTVLLVGAGSLYAFDRSHKTKIAEGVKVNGVDVSGLTPAQAAPSSARRCCSRSTAR